MIAKRTIPLVIAALVGVLMIATYFIPYDGAVGAEAMEMFIILAAAAMVLGAGNLLLLNLSKISKRQPGWGYAGITLMAFFVTLIIGLFKIGAMPTPSSPGQCVDRAGGAGRVALLVDLQVRTCAAHGDDVRDARLLHRLGRLPRLPGQEP